MRILMLLLCLFNGPNLLGAGIFYKEEDEAKVKLDAMWLRIEDSKYLGELPGWSPRTLKSLRQLGNTEFVGEAFKHDGDLMIEGRRKLIHTSGTAMSISFKVNEKSKELYSGLLFSGAEYGILRLSLARDPGYGCPHKAQKKCTKASKCKFIPGIAIKLFRNYTFSANIVAMPSLKAQFDPNLFEHDFTTSIPSHKHKDITVRILSSSFERTLKHLGQENGNIHALSCTDFAKTCENGFYYPEAKVPYGLRFSPTDEAKALFKGISDEDFRTYLDGRGEGISLFNVFAYDDETDTKGVLVGEIQTRSGFIASSFGDEDLFFKHEKAHELNVH